MVLQNRQGRVVLLVLGCLEDPEDQLVLADLWFLLLPALQAGLDCLDCLTALESLKVL